MIIEQETRTQKEMDLAKRLGLKYMGAGFYRENTKRVFKYDPLAGFYQVGMLRVKTKEDKEPAGSIDYLLREAV